MAKIQLFNPDSVKNIRLIATDMDGTLTQAGRFTAQLLQGLTDLAIAQVPVLIVTGRSAGWVQGLVNYLPITGAIAENGGLFYSVSSEEDHLLSHIENKTDHRDRLAQTFAQLQAERSQLHESTDNCFRITDWTFDVQGLSSDDLHHLAQQCQAEGWSFTHSTVQCHIKPQGQDKAAALSQVLGQYFPHLDPTQVLTVGDSPNDESLFNPDQFPCSVGVANVEHYLQEMKHQPKFVTQKPESEGFCEMVRLFLGAIAHA
jgi:HAD superfamily hydrolase (TIGR01484 family)